MGRTLISKKSSPADRPSPGPERSTNPWPGRWPAGPAARGPGGLAAAGDVAVPAHDRVRGNQQPQSLAPMRGQHAPRLVRQELLRSARAPGVDRTSEGVTGDPRRASAELGQVGVDAIVAQTVDAIKRAMARR